MKSRLSFYEPGRVDTGIVPITKELFVITNAVICVGIGTGDAMLAHCFKIGRMSHQKPPEAGLASDGKKVGYMSVFKNTKGSQWL